MITVYRYYAGNVPTKDRKLAEFVSGEGEKEYVEWPQCCTMAWLANVGYATVKSIAQAMVDHDNSYVATFLCSIPVLGSGYTSRLSVKSRDALTKIGWRCIQTIPGPYNATNDHGQDMEIWMYSMVEHGTYRKLRTALAEFIDPSIVPTEGEAK